jgi:tRNA-dihydrouridine synthase B
LTPSVEPVFWIGEVPVYGDSMLAPMDGYTDQPMRRICREYGSAMSYTEFISARDVLARKPYISEKYAFHETERPVVFQLLDDEPLYLLEAALHLMDYRPDVIDVNMGCPARGVAGRGAGAGLLRTPLQIARIFRLLTHALPVPVTAKIRLGWDDSDRQSALLAACIVEEYGGALVAVHGRTKKQAYEGEVDLDGIAHIRQALHIPVVANGDIKIPEDVERVKAYTGCPAVMIGRAAIGNPWIFAGRARADIPLSEVEEVVRKHLEWMISAYGAERGMVFFRKHLTRYLAPYEVPKDLRLSLLTTPYVDEFSALLSRLFSHLTKYHPTKD